MLQTILIKECSINPSGSGRRDGEGRGQEGEGGKEVVMRGRIPVGNGQWSPRTSASYHHQGKSYPVIKRVSLLTR